MSDHRVAFYARVSTEQQARDHTIASQVASLRERIAADGWPLEPEDAYIDEGYSGSLLLRPALERLRDAVAAGVIDRVYVLAPDRLARRYAHQVLLIEEFRRAGAEVIFLNHPIGGTAEDDLLLQRRHRRIRARQDSRAQPSWTPPRGPLGPAQRLHHGALWVSLHPEGPRRRGGAV